MLGVSSLFYRVWFSRHFEEIYKSVWFVIVRQNTYRFFRRFLSGDLFSVGSLLFRVWFSRRFEEIYKRVSICYYLIEHSILVFSSIFVWRFIECRQSVLIRFDLVDILKKFIKGFDSLLFGRTQHICFSIDLCPVIFLLSILWFLPKG